MKSRLLRVPDWEKLAADAGYKAKKMATQCRVTLRQLERFFKFKFKKTPIVWLRELKCRLAAESLLRGRLTKQAASDAGFASSTHFCREFKMMFGISPQCFPLKCASEAKMPH